MIDVSGHTMDHVAYYVPGAVFCGDALFSMGCGRVFEGRPADSMAALQRLASLPEDTLVFCGHEYTDRNAEFAMTVNPTNEALAERISQVRDLRRKGLPTIPTTIAMEKATNPFLRTWDNEIRTSLKLGSEASDLAVFTALRKRRNWF